MTPLDYAIIGLLVIGIPVLLFGWFILQSAKKKVSDVPAVSIRPVIEKVVGALEKSKDVRSASLQATFWALLLRELADAGYREFSELAELISAFDKSIKPKLFEEEKKRIRECLESDNYEKNRVGIYAYDSLRDGSLKRYAERLLSKLSQKYPTGEDPYHLLQIGRIASAAIVN